MTDSPLTFDDDDLHAFADGRLAEERKVAVRARLAEDPAAWEQVASWQRQNDLIGRLYRGTGPDLLPIRLRPELMRRGRRRMLKRMAAAMVGGLLAGGGVGWLARGAGRDSPDEELSFAQEAARAHWRSSEAVTFEVDADGVAHLPDWFEQRLKRSVPVPDLTNSGLRLLGGSAPASSGSGSAEAVQLVYEDPDQERFTLYMTWSDRHEPSEFRFFRTDDVNGFYWPHDELRCVLTADIDPDRLLEIARLAYDQMELDEIASHLMFDE